MIFFPIELYKFLPILDINLLSDIWFTNIFSHSVGCIFISLMISLAVQNLFMLIYLCCVAFAGFHWSFLLSSYSISALLLFFPSFYKFWALLILLLVPWVVNIGYFFKFFLISWGSHLSPWTSLLELLSLHSISFGMLYFHFHLSHGIFYNLRYLFWAFRWR